MAALRSTSLPFVMLFACVVLLPACTADSSGPISSDPKDYELQFRVKETEVVGRSQASYVDLDADGSDERILVSYGENPNTSLVLVTTQSGAVINQKMLPPTKYASYCFAEDINGDEKKDLFIVAREGDTVLAYAIDIFSSQVLARFSLLSKPSNLSNLPIDAAARITELLEQP